MNIIFRLISGIILNYPGAYIRRFLFKREHEIEYYLKDSSVNYFVSMLVITLLTIIFIILKKI